MDARNALRRLRRALNQLPRDPPAKLRLALDNDPPGVANVALTGIRTHQGVLTLHLTVHLDDLDAEPPHRRPH